MIKIVAISLALVLSVLMLALSNWFTQEEAIVSKINQEYKSEIQKLKKIKSINEWLDKIVKPELDKVPLDIENSDEDLVRFFDKNAENFNFKVNKYIYENEKTHNIDITFEILRNDKDRLTEILQLKRNIGFIQFKSFTLKDKKLTGELRIIQPLYGDINASHR